MNFSWIDIEDGAIICSETIGKSFPSLLRGMMDPILINTGLNSVVRDLYLLPPEYRVGPQNQPLPDGRYTVRLTHLQYEPAQQQFIAKQIAVFCLGLNIVGIFQHERRVAGSRQRQRWM